MEKKFKFSDNPAVSKGIYGAIIALLCITAIVIGIVAANNKSTGGVIQNPPVDDGTGDNGNGTGDGTPDGSGDAVTFIAPVSGTVTKKHSTDTPVYSDTLEEWRIHTGIDISTAENADVFAACAGEVTSVYSHPLLGQTVEITHKDGSKTVYSNLSSENLVSVGKTVSSGEKIGCIGDSAICEIAEEAHLHFEMIVDGKSVDPLKYITEDAKQSSLGIDSDTAA